MSTRNAFSMVAALLLALPLAATADEPLLMQLKWKPGETHKYTIHCNSEITASGQSGRMNLDMDFGYGLRVLERPNAPGPRRAGTTPPAPAGTPIYLSDPKKPPTMDVGLFLDDMKQVIRLGGQKIEIVIGKDEVTARLDGNSLPSSQLGELRDEIKPFQALLKSQIRLVMTRTGRIVKIEGLGNLNADMQEDLAKDLLNAVSLPEKALRVGDKFTDVRKLEDMFPRQYGGASAWNGQAVHATWVLADIHRDTNDHRIARMTALIQQEFQDVPIDEDGNRGGIELDLNGTRLYDIELGTLSLETVTGKVLIRPSGSAHMPGLITVKLSVTSKLVEIQSGSGISRSIVYRTARN